MPLHERVFGYPDGSVLVALVPSKFLVQPRVRVSREAQATLRFPLFDGSNQALNAILAGICEVFFVLDDLAHFADESIVVADHSVKTLIPLDAATWLYLQACILDPIQRMTGTAMLLPIAL